MAAVLYDNQNQDLIVMALLLDLLVLKAYLSSIRICFIKCKSLSTALIMGIFFLLELTIDIGYTP